MKNIYAIIFTCCFVFSALAQKVPALIRLKNGDFKGDKNLLNKKITNQALQNIQYQKKYYVLIQFDRLPGIIEKKELSARGIILFDYLPHNAFMAEIADSSAFAGLKRYSVTGIYSVPLSFKISEKLIQRLDQHIVEENTFIAVTFFGTTEKAIVIKEALRLGAQVITTKIQPANVIFIKASSTVAKKVAALPFVTYVSEQHLKDIPLNYNNRAIHALNGLSATSGRNLQGKNVTIGVGDDADPSTHIDFAGRLIQRNQASPFDHGTHVAGTTGGGGILQPRYKGMAPKATLVSQYYSDLLVNADVYLNDYNMVLTNNSYYSGAIGCPGEGEYDVLSNYVDAQLNADTSMLDVFAAGNDGGLTCTPYPNFFATIKSGFQCGKNILTVGAIDNTNYTIANFSSRGPVSDGRIKPEIVAGGVNITSTLPYNLYDVDNGTSMAAPTVTGTLALLYERYRQLHGITDPSAALIKAIACNSADDLGNPGPDYTYGFGMLNARTAVETIENNQYFTGTINNAGTVVHSITGLPTGVQQLKIMLYWPDPAASPFAATALVNNLDLTVTEPNGTTIHHPLILNPNPLNVNDNAVEGIDNNNNIEQVVINNPPAGNFTVTVNGTSIPAGPQKYIIAYQIINPSVTVEYPFGSETWVPLETETIRWSAYGGNGNTFTIEYSDNNGSSWKMINNSVPSASRSYAWPVDSIATNNALIRVTRNNVGYNDVSDYNFTILGCPSITVTNPCQGYAKLDWRTITSATKYEIMMLKGDSMQTIASTTDTSYLLAGLNKDGSYWLSVRAINNTSPGRRSAAANILPAGGGCSLRAFNNDFTVNSLIAPVTGRMYTSSQLGISNIQVALKNLGSIGSVSAFNISYQVNSGAVVTETSTQIINAGSSYNYTFLPAHSYDFSAVGSDTIKVWIDYPGDPQLNNDTLIKIIKQLQNDPVTLTPNYTEGFESATAQSYSTKTMGFTGLDRCDFSANNANGRARTFVNTGFARTGIRCVTLDRPLRDNITGASSSDSLITTFNLSGYTATDQIWLDYYYKNHGIDFTLPGNRVWIRGNDQAAWIPVETLSINAKDIGIYKASKSIDVTGTLAGAVPAQTISSSFQVRFGEQGFTSASSVIPDGNLDDGYSFDDITLTKGDNDMALKALMQPSLSNICALSNAETISVQVKNYSSLTLSAIPVTYSVNGMTVTESIPTIGPSQTITYIFSQKADLSLYQHYSLQAWVTYSGDTYHKNDTLPVVDFYTTPVISSYPYLEGFENNDGHWYTQGTNDSWEWGAPAKTVINKAANGTKAWVTSLTGNYNDNELSYLYSPCFNLSSLASPVLSFSHIFQTEDDCDCDYHWVEYSTNDVTWIRPGAVGNGTNWYDNLTNQAWQLSDTKWHVSSYNIPTTAAKVRFRIVMKSDPATNYEGVGIDDIHVFDKAAIYSGVNITSGLTQNVSGSNWINFNAGGKRVISINPNGQNLGSTNVNVYINTSAIRNNGGQYYLDRNIVIQPATPPTGNVSVRFYFLNTEVKKLINASGCGICTTLNDAYAAGVTQYSNAPAEENGTLNDNVNGTYNFITPQNVAIIPYDSGYYAEYQVNGFSEFWINGGGPGQNQSLPLLLQMFTAARINNKALLQWSTSQEVNSDRFIIEKSPDGIQFSWIGTIKAQGNSSTVSSYQFIDTNLLYGANYYRLKIIDLDGHFQYSPVRYINFTENDFSIGLYPNPVKKGVIHINTSANCNSVELYDVSGRFIKAKNTFGFQNTFSVANIAKGIYMITIKTDAGIKNEKVIVE